MFDRCRLFFLIFFEIAGVLAHFSRIFSRFYVRIFHVKINLDRGCLRGVGYFFPWIADV